MCLFLYQYENIMWQNSVAISNSQTSTFPMGSMHLHIEGINQGKLENKVIPKCAHETYPYIYYVQLYIDTYTLKVLIIKEQW